MNPKSLCDHSASSMSAQRIGANDEGEACTLVNPMTQHYDTVPIDAAPGGCYFDVFCAERVSLTSIFFAGGDWRWTFHAAGGAVLVQSEGYISQAACLSAIAALQAGAGSSTIQHPVPSLRPFA